MRPIDQEINDFLKDFSFKHLAEFLGDIMPLFELYDVNDNDDWIEKEIEGDKEYIQTVRLIRTVYLFSRIAEFHSGKLLAMKTKHKDLWKRMEKEVITFED